MRTGDRARELLAAIAVGCDVACRIALCLRQRLEARRLVSAAHSRRVRRRGRCRAPAAADAAPAARCLVDAAAAEQLQRRDQPQRRTRPSARCAKRFRRRRPSTACCWRRLEFAASPHHWKGAAGFFRLFAGGPLSTSMTLLRGLGQRWHIDALSFKPWPSCRGTHAAIECALQLRSQPRSDLRQVDQIIIEGGSVQAHAGRAHWRASRAPQTAIDAKFSLPFTVALALVRGAVTLDSFDARLARAIPELRALAARVRTSRLRPDWGRDRATSAARSRSTCVDGDRPAPRGAGRAAAARPGRSTMRSCWPSSWTALARAAEPLRRARHGALARRILDLEDDAGRRSGIRLDLRAAPLDARPALCENAYIQRTRGSNTGDSVMHASTNIPSRLLRGQRGRPGPRGCRLIQAAEAKITLDEVIVTAERREQNLQDVPISATVFTGGDSGHAAASPT